MRNKTPREAIESAIKTLNVVQTDFNIGCGGAIDSLTEVLSLLPHESELNIQASPYGNTYSGTNSQGQSYFKTCTTYGCN